MGYYPFLALCRDPEWCRDTRARCARRACLGARKRTSAHVGGQGGAVAIDLLEFSVAIKNFLSRQRWLIPCCDLIFCVAIETFQWGIEVCRNKVVGVATGKWYGENESCRDRKLSVVIELVIWCHDLGSWVATQPGGLGGVAIGLAPSVRAL